MKPEMKGILNKIISAVLFVSMAACFIIQTYTQVEKFFMGQVVQGTDTYVPDVVQLPTLIVCREMSAALDKSLLEQKGLPRNMFSGLPLDLNVVNMIPFPDLKQTWELVTMNLNVSGGTMHQIDNFLLEKLPQKIFFLQFYVRQIYSFKQFLILQ